MTIHDSYARIFLDSNKNSFRSKLKTSRFIFMYWKFALSFSTLHLWILGTFYCFLTTRSLKFFSTLLRTHNYYYTQQKGKKLNVFLIERLNYNCLVMELWQYLTKGEKAIYYKEFRVNEIKSKFIINVHTKYSSSILEFLFCQCIVL